MSNRETLQQALECIERCNAHGWILADYEDEVYASIDALKAALAQPEQEPVATVISETGVDLTMSWWHEPALPMGTKLYTTPPATQRPWQGLTDEDKQTAVWTDGTFGGGALWAQQLLKESNG